METGCAAPDEGEPLDEPLALAELYAALMERSRGGENLDRLSGAEQSFLFGQRCELCLRGGGFAAAAASPDAGRMADSLHELGAGETAALLEAALLARHGGGFDDRCRELDARWAVHEEEIGRFCAAWARNHGMMGF